MGRHRWFGHPKRNFNNVYCHQHEASRAYIHRTGILIVLGSNIGITLLILIVALDVGLIALYVLGVAGIVMASEWGRGYRNYSAALFGAAIMFTGLILIR